jgi:predicted transcriptional regulator
VGVSTTFFLVIVKEVLMTFCGGRKSTATPPFICDKIRELRSTTFVQRNVEESVYKEKTVFVKL